MYLLVLLLREALVMSTVVLQPGSTGNFIVNEPGRGRPLFRGGGIGGHGQEDIGPHKLAEQSELVRPPYAAGSLSSWLKWCVSC